MFCYTIKRNFIEKHFNYRNYNQKEINGMTNSEYASRIYCAALKKEDDGDIYVRGVLDMIGTLTEREQLALECRYRNGLTYRQTGREIGGVCGERVRQILVRALRKLRQPSREQRMRISGILEKNDMLQKLLQEKNKIIDEKNAVIDELHRQMDYSVREKSPVQGTANECNEPKRNISDADFSARIYHALTKAGIYDCEQLLAFHCFDDIIRIPNIGKVSILEIALKMREYGYIAWTERAAARTSMPLRAAIQKILE